MVIVLQPPMHKVLELAVSKRGTPLRHVREDSKLVRAIIERHHRVHRVIVARDRLRDPVRLRVRRAAQIVLALQHLLPIRVRVPSAIRGECRLVLDDHLLTPVVGQRLQVVMRDRWHPRRVNWNRPGRPLELNVRAPLVEPDHMRGPFGEGLTNLSHQRPTCHLDRWGARSAGVEDGRRVGAHDIRAADLIRARPVQIPQLLGDLRKVRAPAHGRIVPSPRDGEISRDSGGLVGDGGEQAGGRVESKLVRVALDDERRVRTHHRPQPCHWRQLVELQNGPLVLGQRRRGSRRHAHRRQRHHEDQLVRRLVRKVRLSLRNLRVRQVELVEVQKRERLGALVEGHHLAKERLIGRIDHLPGCAAHRQTHHLLVQCMRERVPCDHSEGALPGARCAHGHIEAVGAHVAVAVLDRLGLEAEQLGKAHRDPLLDLHRRLGDPLLVVVGHRLLFCAGHAVVMGGDSDGALERVGPGGAHRGLLFERGQVDLGRARVRDHLELTSCEEQIRRESHLALESWARGEVAAPVVVRVVSKREDVVGASLVRPTPLLLLVGVERRRRVEHVDGAVHVHVMNELIEVAVPVLRILVVEVGAACPDLVLREGMVRLVLSILHDLVHPHVNIPVVPRRVVVHLVAVVIKVHPSGVAPSAVAEQVAREELGRVSK